MSLRALERRVAKIEKGRKPRPSPFVLLYGSFDAFVDEAYRDAVAGKLCKDFLDVIDILRAWEDGGVWVLAYAR